MLDGFIYKKSLVMGTIALAVMTCHFPRKSVPSTKITCPGGTKITTVRTRLNIAKRLLFFVFVISVFISVIGFFFVFVFLLRVFSFVIKAAGFGRVDTFSITLRRVNMLESFLLASTSSHCRHFFHFFQPRDFCYL
jgi:hypothetical protein